MTKAEVGVAGNCGVSARNDSSHGFKLRACDGVASLALTRGQFHPEFQCPVIPSVCSNAPGG